MLDIYSLNTEVATNTAIPFNSISVNKGCDESLASATTIELNRKGAYLVIFSGSLETATTVQLFKNGVAQEQAQSTGTNPVFSTIVQVGKSNCGCCGSSPVTLQVRNTGSAASTFTDCEVTVFRLPCGGVA